MDKATKIIIGAAVTSLMAWGAHSGIGTGAAFAERLETRSADALADKNISGVDMALKNDPALTRTIILSGDESQKDAAIATVSDVPGAGEVIWAGDEAASDGNAAADADIDPETAQAVAKCQGDIDGLMAGKTINFRSGSAYMSADSNAVVAEIAKALQPCAGMTVEVQGHTDLMGSAELNKNLSQARADAVMAELVKNGMAADRVTAKGYGSEQPVENARTPSANAANRRTAFVVSANGKTVAQSAAKEGEE